ncbi:MAG: retropepsin-like aspartic protease [Comamonas sp.]|uniref:retropepsin-like aspartic protease family protein n=1 Tax=Comamonas sp. lk TaxID=2201272 RepID=UPI000EB349B3|nr:retropepsin-like aspartic protease [Comamonas sp. lk]
MHAFARKLGIWAVSALSLTAAGAGWAQSVALTGVLGSKALLVIDGGVPKAVASNDSHQGVRVLQVGADSVVVEIKGQRQTIRLGEAPVSVGSRGNGVSGSRIVLMADARGHFIDRGQINGKSMQYMVDTGASTVAIGRADAERMGLPYLQGTPVMMRTANGTAQGWKLILDSVRVGDVEVRGLEAIVASQSMPYVLLGNNLLAHFQMTRQGTEMILVKR